MALRRTLVVNRTCVNTPLKTIQFHGNKTQPALLAVIVFFFCHKISVLGIRMAKKLGTDDDSVIRKRYGHQPRRWFNLVIE